MLGALNYVVLKNECRNLQFYKKKRFISVLLIYSSNNVSQITIIIAYIYYFFILDFLNLFYHSKRNILNSSKTKILKNYKRLGKFGRKWCEALE